MLTVNDINTLILGCKYYHNEQINKMNKWKSLLGRFGEKLYNM